MKWFHHECAARHDPKLQMLGTAHGGEGLGTFWGLLEEIGQHSETFHLKVTANNDEADRKFSQMMQRNPEDGAAMFNTHTDLNEIPMLPLKILARNLFTTSNRLKTIIETCVTVGLFDQSKWLQFNVLYSPSFEQRADDYTRRLQRKTVGVRRDSGLRTDDDRSPDEQPPQSNRLPSSNVRSEQHANPDQIQIKGKPDEELLVEKTSDEKPESGTEQSPAIKDELFLIELSGERFVECSKVLRQTLCRWNEQHSAKFEWNPSDGELRKLLCGGNYDHKLNLCYQAYNLLGEKINYPELVRRAINLMLKASEKSRINNPFGWLWTCIHGNGDGTTPWVQLMTSDEEQAIGSLINRNPQLHHSRL
jgi:hypothetical protein